LQNTLRLVSGLNNAKNVLFSGNLVSRGAEKSAFLQQSVKFLFLHRAKEKITKKNDQRRVATIRKIAFLQQ